MGIKNVGLRMRYFGVEIKVERKLLVIKVSGCNHRRKSLGIDMNIRRDESCLVGASVQFSHSVVSDSLRPHESQHARPPCPSPTPGVHSDSRPSSR